MNANYLEDILISTALKSNMTSKYACVILYRNKIISTGYNTFKPHSNNYIHEKYEANKHSIHAERNAIRQVKDKHILKYCRIYIIKMKNNEIENGLPCKMCNDLLKKYNITRICDISKNIYYK